MVRKRKKTPSSKPSLPALRQRATSALNSRNFREALELHKQLVKQASTAESLRGLAEAYLGRANELAAKGMYREASALWENMAASCGEEKPWLYVEWLLLGGRLEHGTRRLMQNHDITVFMSPQVERVSTLLALLMLSQPEGVGDALPEDSPLWQQRETMLSALQAYCDGDDVAMREALKRIPFRSSYRDLRILLQALVSLDSEADSARQQLQRISALSPLAPLAEYLINGTQDDLSTLLTQPAALRELSMSLLGWSPERRKILAQFPHDEQHNPRAVLRFAVSLKNLDEALLRRFCLAWLPRYPKALSSAEKRLGTFSTAEHEYIHAQSGEWKRDLSIIKHHWPRCAEALIAEGHPLGAALIYRYLAQIHADTSDNAPSDHNTQNYLQLSLELDPQDQASYLKLVEMARRRGDLDSAYEIIQQALKQFPNEVKIRSLAGDICYMRKAFKQMAEHARVVLERDPINIHARSLLTMAHVNMARQHVKRGRHELALGDLNALPDAPGDSEQRGILAMVRSLVHLSAKQRAQARGELQRSIDLLGESLASRFRFLVHGRRMHINQATLTRLYNELSPMTRQPAPTPDTLMELASLIKRFRVEDDEDVLDTLNQLKKPLREAANLRLDESQYRQLLDELFALEHVYLLGYYASTAIRHFPANGRFQFYVIFARTDGGERGLHFIERQRLTEALDDADAAGDYELLNLVENFFDATAPPSPLDFGFPTELPPMPPEVREVMAQAMADLGTNDPMEVIRFLAQLDEDDLPPFPAFPPPPRGRRR